MTRNVNASPQTTTAQVVRRLLSIPGALVVSAFLTNELLMGITPWRPIPWAAFYFPMRAVGVPVIGIAEVMRLLLPMSRSPTLLQICRTLVGLLVVIGTVWFSWRYRDLIFFDLLDRHDSHARSGEINALQFVATLVKPAWTAFARWSRFLVDARAPDFNGSWLTPV
jgi:hypothetical protein